MSGMVYLVGAGCGPADLITLRGLRRLETCNVVVYDALIDPALLAHAPEGAQRLCVGKRAGAHAMEQGEIDRLLVSLARAGKTVVRLKGGDPFVFGRGGEEALALEEAGVPYELVPGISSAIAIPEEAGIPVTHRGMSRCFHVITAQTAQGQPLAWETLAALEGTLVFLMGLHALPELVQALIRAGKRPDTPAAVLSGGNAAHPAQVRGPLAELPRRAREAGVLPPAVIVVGETAALRLNGGATLPLTGRTVGLTGTDHMAETLAPALRALGAAVYRAQRSVVEPVDSGFAWRSLADGQPRWLVLTSPNGAELFVHRLREHQIDLRALHRCRFAVVGPATGDALRRYGIFPDLCPERYTTAALGDALLRAASPETPAVLFRAEGVSSALCRQLSAHCTAPVEEVPLYRLRDDGETARQAAERLPGTDLLVFSSASGVELFHAHHPALPEGTQCVCIGPVTGAAFARRYPVPCRMAAQADAQGLIDAALALCARTGQAGVPVPF